MKNPRQLLEKHLAGSQFYSHSVGEYYHYRGKILDVKIVERESDEDSQSLCIEVRNVETMSCDIDDIWEVRDRPSEILGSWQKDDEFEYFAPIGQITLNEEADGIRISFAHSGVVYIAK